MVEGPPGDRARVVDFLRAASICAVVVGHWSIAVVWWDHGVLRVTSAIGVTSRLWLATWVLQVMPIFFFVGGFSNLVSYDAARRRGETSGGGPPAPPARVLPAGGDAAVRAAVVPRGVPGRRCDRSVADRSASAVPV